MGTAIGLYVFIVFFCLLFYLITEPRKISSKRKALAFLTIVFWPIALPLWILFFVLVSIKTLFQKDPEKLFEEKVKNISIDELALEKRLLVENIELQKELTKLKKN